MKILDILTSPWAIQPAKLLEIQGIYATHLRGEKIDIRGIEAAIGKPLNNQPMGYSITNGVAVLPINGVISKRMNLMTQISGGVSSELVARDLSAALADPDVNSIILQIDSPGGTVDGTEPLANLIKSATKPVIALADGTMASAAYWIGCAANAIYMTDTLTQVGSIGVVSTHTDISGAEAQRGIKTTEIAAGKYKRIASQYGALTEGGKQTMQDQVDYIYSMFVQSVASNRGVSVDTVLQNMADGRIFIGQQAIDAGLVDGVSTLDALIAKLSQQGAGQVTGISKQKSGSTSAAIAAAEQPIFKGELAMNITMQDILSHAPDIAETLRAEGRIEGNTTGANDERVRIQSVFAQSMSGHDALIQSLAFDGKTTGPEAAVAVLNAERTLRGNALSARQAEAPKPVAHAAAESDVSAAVAAASNDSPQTEAQARAQWDASGDLQKEFAGSFQTYWAAIQVENKSMSRK